MFGRMNPSPHVGPSERQSSRSFRFPLTQITLYCKVHGMNAAPIVKRIAALTFIFLCTTIAWLILGATIFSRTYSSGQSLEGKVSSSWGSQQSQAAPTASYYVDEVQPEEVQVDGRP